jgi:arylsulfatase A-like enzyme
MPTRPNIILLFPDQWRADHLGCAGHPSLRTPHLDEMALHGTRFTTAYSPSPTCIAARASLLTGLGPARTGRLGYRDGVAWRYPWTMAGLLRDAGYQTMCVGKTHYHPMRAHLGFETLDLYDANLAHNGATPDDYRLWLRAETGGRVRDSIETCNSNDWMPHPWVHEERLHPNCWTTERAVSALERRDPLRPFFLSVNWHRPHPPYDPPLRLWQDWARREPPPPHLGDWCDDGDKALHPKDASLGRLPPAMLSDTRRAYAAQIEHLDEQIGHLQRWLAVNHLLQSTWLVFASDHGEMLGDHHRFRKGCPFAGSARIPLIVRPAGRSRHLGRDEAPATCPAPVSLFDLLPTFCAISGAKMPEGLDGRDLLPLLSDARAPWRAWLHGEHSDHHGWQFLAAADRLYAWDSLSGREWLFDTAEDRAELRNLAQQPGQAGDLDLWRGRLVQALADRPQDGLVENGRLTPGRKAPTVRPALLEPDE